MNRWFTSDTHFWHESVLKFCPNTRDGDSAEEMNEIMIQNWNSLVKRGDIVYHMGDFSFGGKEKIRSLSGRLNGDIHIVWGNHDHMLRKTKEFSEMFVSTNYIKNLKIGGHRFFLCHYPLAEWPDCHKGVIHIHGHCFDDNTEVLTEAGWKCRTEVSPTEMVATFNVNTGEVEYQRALSKTEYYLKGDMLEYDGSRVNFLFTPEHRVLNRNSRGEGLKFDEISNIRSTAIIPLCGENKKSDYPISDEYLRLYINICADGSFENYGKLVRFHLRKERKIDKLVGILEELNIKYSMNKQKSGSTKINFKKPSELTAFSVKPLDRDLLMNLSKRQIDIVIDEYSLTDGCMTGENSIQISTSKESEANLLQEVFVTSGVSCNLVERQNGGYVLSLNKKRKELIFTKSNMRNLKYKGYVWCLTVPNSTLIIRRGGKVHITGNCHGNKDNVGHQQQFKIFDCGVDTRSDKLMVPYHIDEVLEAVEHREIMSHH